MSTSHSSLPGGSTPDDSDHANRQIRFGTVALKLGLLSREQYAREMESWIEAGAPDFAQWLVERRQLTVEQVEQIERAMYAERAASHDNSADSLPSERDSEFQQNQLSDSRSRPSTGADPLRPRSDTDPNSRQEGEDVYETRVDFRATRQQHEGLVPADLLLANQRQLLTTFEIRGKLGQGGQGIVWLARDLRLKRDVAIKELRPNLAKDEGLQQRLVQEAKIISVLEHPGIVPVYGIGKFGSEQPFYAMRLIEGKTLASAIKQELRIGFPDGLGATGGGAISRNAYEKYLRKYLSHFITACNAVAYAHSRGVLHRDLKPANIMLGQFGEAWVVDWGLAKAGLMRTGAPEESTIAPPLEARSTAHGEIAVDPTMEGVYIGTPQYMSPEQARGQVSRFGIHTDVFCLGATLYFLLVGKAPYEAP
ncbi:MAG: serine/threonine-protein kinase, partial [Planctomycetota bacterium]